MVDSVASRIGSEREYKHTQKLLDEWIDRTGGDEEHPMAGFVDYLGHLISDYEREHVPEPTGTPADVLRLLMDEHGLKQSDLAKDLGGQGVVSQILNGKRELNLNQVRALSRRFKVSPAVFIAE